MKKACVVLLACLLPACGGEDDAAPARLGPPRVHAVPGCEGYDHRPCDVLNAACQERLMGIAACLRGQEPPELPPVSVMTEEEFAAYLRDWLAMQEPVPNPNHYEEAMVLLRLAAPNDFSPDITVSEEVEFIYGLYRFATKDIVLVDHGEDSTPEVSSAVLVHEFVHALQDQDVDLTAYFDEYATSQDSYLAVDALSEGEARLHELRYASAAFGYEPAEIDYGNLFQNVIDVTEDDLVSAPFPYTRGMGLFPYVWGGRYAHLVWESGGLDAILSRFASPTLTTRALMASVDAPEVDAPEPPAITGPVPPAEWVPFTEVTLGAFGVFLLLTQMSPNVDSARDLALAWQNDRLFIYQGGTSGLMTALSWRIDFADEAAAASVVANATELVGSVRQQGTRVVIGLDNEALPTSWLFEP